MKTSQKGIDLIKTFEGLRLTAYHDIAGVLTIGYGTTGKHVHEGQHIDKGLAEDVAKFEHYLNKYVHVPLAQGEFDALVSFTYNLGVGALHSSTLLKKLNDRQYEEAAFEFRRWTHANHKVVAGLVKRRAAEEALFTSTA